MSVEKKTQVQTIDLTPTWEGILGVIIVTLEAGNAQGKKVAKEELLRMARLADLYVVSQKVTTGCNPPLTKPVRPGA